MSVLLSQVPVYPACAFSSGRSKEGFGYPESGITDSYEPPGVC